VLTNVARHADATTAAIRLHVVDTQLELEISDDGVGGATMKRGLRGLADRVEALGGMFELSSPPGGPTRVRAVLEKSR
jgi:signal transduction histidine kinase